jgi:ADP-dependent NAD(P)H-hydrate dehydratase / NAD(P)H-hydrate epimerase
MSYQTENCSPPKSRRRPPLEALLAAVQLHDIVADHLVAEGCGPVGLTAGKIIDGARF